MPVQIIQTTYKWYNPANTHFNLGEKGKNYLQLLNSVFLLAYLVDELYIWVAHWIIFFWYMSVPNVWTKTLIAFVRMKIRSRKNISKSSMVLDFWKNWVYYCNINTSVSRIEAVKVCKKSVPSTADPALHALDVSCSLT